MHVLIVDDIEHNLYLLDFMLRNAGSIVYQAHNGREALDILEREPVELIISDILMPEMDGYELCRACKNDDRWRNLPFVFYTATYTTEEDRKFSLALGASRFIIKPQEPKAFLAQIREIMNEWKQGRLDAGESRLENDTEYLKRYNERLVHKLEDKLKQLERKNLRLTDELTRRRRAEQRAEIMMAAIESMDQSVMICDAEGVVWFANPAARRHTDLDSDSKSGMVTAIFSETHAGSAGLFRHLWDCLRTGENWHGELEMRLSDEKTYPASVAITPVSDVGESRHVVVVWQDISEQRELQEQFFEAQKMESIGTLAGGVAHDFNNILAGLMMNIYMANQHADSPDDLRQRLEVMNQLSERAKHLVSQMLTFARKDQVKMEPLGLHELLDEAMELIRPGLPENIALEFECDDPALVCLASRVQIEQVLINLVNNAADALADSESPKIVVQLRECELSKEQAEKKHLDPGRYAHLSVADNGAGIEDCDRIFEPFYTTKEVGKGTGLGLAMVYGSISRHGGVIEVESIPDHGTRFDIYLPLADHQVEAACGESVEEIAGRNRLVIIADDEPLIRSSLAEMLHEFGFRIEVAENGRDALTLMEKHRDEVSLVLLDVIMPEMSGPDAGRKMRAIRPELPILFLTGYNRSHVLDPAMASLSGCAVLQKPFEVSALVSKLESLLGEQAEDEGATRKESGDQEVSSSGKGR